MQTITGSCHCNAVTFEVPKTLNDVRYCHCTTCRQLSGTAFSVVSLVQLEDFKLTKGAENLIHYRSSPHKNRAHCKTCFPPIFVQLDTHPNDRRIRLGSLNQEPNVNITAHIWVSQKPEWSVINDDLPQMLES